jgi:competence protein ComGC
MRPAPFKKSQAFTFIELLLVILLCVVLLSLCLPAFTRARQGSHISCINNLKQLGISYRIWASDHHDRFPASESVSDGGWREFLDNPNQGSLCWTNYLIMANEIGQSSRVLICPSDERKPVAGNFIGNFVSNTNLSYFVGVSADLSRPQSLLAGDRNLGGGTKPDRDYGFSLESGRGNDIAIQTNSKTGPVCWSLKMHTRSTNYCGNFLLGDGSAQQVTSESFRRNWQPNFAPTTNWPIGHVPSSPSVRVLFP